MCTTAAAIRPPPVPSSLLADFRDHELNVHIDCDVNEEWRSALPHANFQGAPPYDIAVACETGRSNVLDVVLPGGIAVFPREDWSLFAMSVPHAAPYEPDGPRRDVKTTVAGDGAFVALKKGLLDDNDHMTLGDYGSEYGEYRWGVFSRALRRSLGFVWPATMRDYFATQMALFEAPLGEVRISMVLPHKVSRSDVVKFKRRDGKRVSLQRDVFLDAIREDICFSLAVHRERISAEIGGDNRSIVARIFPWRRVFDVDAAAVPDYALHEKMRPWLTWRAYFGAVEPQPQVVVAQTAREKSLMVDDDLSDFYTGRVTAGVLEGRVQVSLASADCEGFAQALALHHLTCFSSGFSDNEVAGRHSALYALAAKEKFDGSIGVAAEASLREMHSKTRKPWPPLSQLEVGAARPKASLGFFEGKAFANDRPEPLLAELPHGVDVLIDRRAARSCKGLDDLASRAVAPGGVWILEGLDECGGKGWPDLVSSLEAFATEGMMLVGRNIAAASRRDTWVADARRLSWPQDTDWDHEEL